MVVEKSVEGQEPSKNMIVYVECPREEGPNVGHLQKRNKHGPWWCVLCKYDGESVTHIFLKFPYNREVWEECTRTTGILCTSKGFSVARAWEF